MDFDPVAYINAPRWQQSRLGLERIRELLERLGRPQDTLRFVHVAGTNGKGSTSCYLASVLQKAHYKVGLFTSPFIETFQERIRVDGLAISADELLDVTLAVREQAETQAAATGDHPTEFELMTAVALMYFARSECDVVVLEVGLGGRLDSTNIINAPEAAVITRIGLDHTSLLGNTVAAIAQEKAGIIKTGSAVVSWPQEDCAMAVIENVASVRGNSVTVPDFATLNMRPVMLEAKDAPQVGVRLFSYRGKEYKTYLLGSYQPKNAALAIETIEALRMRGWNISDEALRSGIESARWPGRFEIVPGTKTRPLFIIDGGHNPQGTEALVDSLKEVFPHRKPVFIIGVLEDKDYPRMLETVLPLAKAFVTVAPPNPRALSAERLARTIRLTGQDLWGCSACLNPYEARDFDDAVKTASKLARPDGLVCAFGSLYSVAAIKAALANV